MQEEEIKTLIHETVKLKAEIHRRIIGQDEVLDQVLISFLAGGHALLEGVPGLAKTLMVRTLAEAVDLSFKRIQFTPDLMPSDIIGTEILQTNQQSGQRLFHFVKGPLFANIILADEINRTPPKTQAALLEAMQERAVTYSGKRYKMANPFFLLATQNPIEQAGTFPLPEAQIDRFLLYIKMEYPRESEELEVLEATTSADTVEVNKVMTGEDILSLQRLIREVPISRELTQWVNRMMRATRPQQSDLEPVRKWVQWGAGTRAGQSVILAAKARALMQDRYAVIAEDIRSVILPAVRHRILLNFQAQAEGIHTDELILDLMRSVKIT